jgi:signal transduction histidine kinase
VSAAPRSIRARVTLIAVLAVAAVLIANAVLVVLLQRRSLMDNLDQSLEQRADQIAASLGDLDGGFANSNTEDRFAQLLDDEGRLVVSTDNVAGGPIPVDASGSGSQKLWTTSDVPLEDDAYRMLVRRVDGDTGSGVLIVGENIDDLQDAVGNLAFTLAGLIPVVVVALGALVWWLVGRTLQPVEQIRREVAEISLERLDRRVPDPDTGDEIDRLASTMNAMLDRLESSNARLQRFVADASHELRSPLTRIRSSVEVDLAAADRDLDETCRGVLEETVAIQELVDDLLFLARNDDPHVLPHREHVDLDVVVDREVERLREETGAVVDMTGVSAGLISGDPSQMARLVRNLLNNGSRHARERVVVTLAPHGGSIRLIVDDDGAGVAEDDRDRIFDRFTRLDEARTATTGGTGLGLAIARDIAVAHGGTIRCETAPSGGARFVVELPAVE